MERQAELARAIAEVLAAGPGHMVLSAPRAGGKWRRATYTLLEGGWREERLTGTQAFHRAVGADELPGVLAEGLTADFTQLTAHDAEREWAIKRTKKGKVLTRAGRLATAARTFTDGGPATGGPAAASQSPPGHDRPKNRLLPEGAAIPPLVDIGVMTAEGRVVAAMRDKYRQINRFVELVADVLPSPPPQRLRVVDFGCGKSYLTFVLYYYLINILGVDIEMTGLDLKAEVVAHCNAAAGKYGYTGLHFEAGDIADYQNAAPIDMVVTLHACDTATDHALAKAVGWGAKAILSVPCCQHELNAQMRSDELGLLTRYGLVKERTAALMTDAIRANLLAACGYKTQLVEFVGFEHTPKNIMIRAVGSGLPKKVRQGRLDEVLRLCAAFGLSPSLLALLREAGALEGLNEG